MSFRFSVSESSNVTFDTPQDKRKSTTGMFNVELRTFTDMMKDENILEAFADWLHQHVCNSIDQLETFEAVINGIYKSNHAIARKLLSHRDPKDKNRTLLHQVAILGNYPVFSELVDRYRAEITDVDSRKCTVLHLAAIHGSLKIVNYIMANSPGLITQQDQSNNIALNLAAANGHVRIMERLLSNRQLIKSTIENKGHKGRTPLLCAAANGRVPAIELLLRYNADWKAHDADNHSAVSLSSSRGHLNVCQFLIEKGGQALIEERSGFENLTSLQWAAKNGHDKVAAFMARIGADLWAKSEDGNESLAIHLASQHGHLEIVKSLVQSDERLLEAKDGNNNTVTNLAFLYGHSDIVQYCVSDCRTKNRIPLSQKMRAKHLSTDVDLQRQRVHSEEIAGRKKQGRRQIASY